LQREFADAKPIRVLSGKATYYSDSLAGRAMASGEIYQPDCAQAAHRTLPFGSVARVRMVKSGEWVIVRITDRGPYAGKDRIIDLSYSAARQIGLLRQGVADVRVEVLHVAK
jgi:rare lipoprotein A